MELSILNKMDIVIVDFGSQTTHLIGRRIRELGAESKISEPESALKEIKTLNPKGIILSGGPASVYEKNSPTVSKEIFEMGIPILGICYGQQLIAYLLGGDVRQGKIKEYGPAILEEKLEWVSESQLLKRIEPGITVWMSHGDNVISPPEGFRVVASTKTIACAVIEDRKRKIYGIQFHPEVVHTQSGDVLLETFIKICGLSIKKKKINKEFVENLVKDVKDSIGDKKAICATSGGVDSSVAALLVHKAIGKNLTSIYVDSGLMREGETKQLKEIFASHFQMNVDIVDAKKEFLNALKGITDPEKKRKVIGKTFIEVFEKEAKKMNKFFPSENGVRFLVQGTIYPDVIESKGSKHSEKIKSHHNVAGLPKNLNLILIEPLRQFYKDEVRKIGDILDLPKSITRRQPFPGPGMAVRIIGEVTEKKLEILRKADKIVQEEMNKFFATQTEKAKELEKSIWQYFAILTGVWTTGVRGDAKVYGETIALRAIEAEDAMSAAWAKLPYAVLDNISVRIVTEVREVNRVVYDISNKPPATMEWE